MRLKIEAVYGRNKARKAVSFNISEEMADELRKIFADTDDGSFNVTGAGMMSVEFSLLHAERRF